MRALIAALLVATPLHAATLEGKADVVDGDTIKVESSVVVRLQGIDAPETLQTCERDGKSYECGKRATKALADFIAGRPVRCELVGRDGFKRALGVCFVGGTEINAAMVAQGWALAFVKYSDAYSAQQAEAEIAKAGMWAGTFARPWDWRLGKAEVTLIVQGELPSASPRSRSRTLSSGFTYSAMATWSATPKRTKPLANLPDA